MSERVDTLHLDAPAKVNLRLEILRKREDGYHDIRTIFQKINIYDTLLFSLKRRRGIRITSEHRCLPTGRKNLIYQALRSMLEKSDYKGGVDVLVEKRIPLGAGLGGGSSNAAATLKALNELLKMNIGTRELMEAGAKIGADVPFFLFEGSAIGTGIGERLKKITLPPLWYILIYPNFEISTRWAYQNFVLTRSAVSGLEGERELKSHRSGSPLSHSARIPFESRKRHLYGQVEGLTKTKYHINLRELLKSPNRIVRLLQNDLEEVVSQKYPEIALMKGILLSAGAAGAMMTGSGPTVFGLFTEEQVATEAFQKLKGRIRRKGWEIFKAHSL